MCLEAYLVWKRREGMGSKLFVGWFHLTSDFHHNHHNNTLLTYLSPAQNVEYYQCTYADSPVPWCATGTDSTGTVIPNQWGDCVVSQVMSWPILLSTVPGYTIYVVCRCLAASRRPSPCPAAPRTPGPRPARPASSPSGGAHPALCSSWLHSRL